MNLALTARRSARRPDLLVTAAVRVIGHALVAALAVFHAGLLALHLVDGRAFEPDAAARWGLALLVVAGFRALSRRGLPLFTGRRAIGLWLLVVLIHCSAASDGSAAAFERAIPESVRVLAQVSFIAGAISVALTAVLASATQPRTGGRPGFSVPVLIAGLPSSGFVYCFSPRPPPLD